MLSVPVRRLIGLSEKLKSVAIGHVVSRLNLSKLRTSKTFARKYGVFSLFSRCMSIFRTETLVLDVSYNVQRKLRKICNKNEKRIVTLSQ